MGRRDQGEKSDPTSTRSRPRSVLTGPQVLSRKHGGIFRDCLDLDTSYALPLLTVQRFSNQYCIFVTVYLSDAASETLTLKTGNDS